MLKIGLKKLSGERCPTLSLPNDRNDIEFSHELAAISYGVLVTPQFGIGITSDGFAVAWLAHHLPKIDNDDEWFPGKCDREQYGPPPAINGSNQVYIDLE